MHGSATTTPVIRKAIRSSRLPIRALAAKYGINPKTAAKWKSRPSPDDLPMGPHRHQRRKLSAEEEGTCIGFRIHTLLPLDDCLYALQLMMPHLTRSSLHRLYQRHGISRLPRAQGHGALPKRAGKPAIGSFYVNAADIRTGDGKANMFFAFDRTSKFAFAKLYQASHPDNGADFLGILTEAAPYSIVSVLSGDSPQFTYKPAVKTGHPGQRAAHPFALACREQRIRHEVLPFDQPWRIHPQAGTGARLAGTTARRFHYETHDHLREHFFAFFETYNFDRRLKTLGGLTPYEYICECWAAHPDLFRLNPVENWPTGKR